MTDRQLESALRCGLEGLATGGLEPARWRLFEAGLGQFARRQLAADREDLRQSFIELLLVRRPLLDELVGAEHGALVPRLRRLFRRHAYEAEVKTEAGRLRKALDDVLRRGDPRFTRQGRFIVARGTHAPELPPSPFLPCGTRFDHARLADGVAALVHELGSVRGRTALARALVGYWGLEGSAQAMAANDDGRALDDRIALARAVAGAKEVLEPRERTLVADAVLGRPLRTARERVGLSIAAAHVVRRSAGRKLSEVAARHGLSPEDRLPLLEALVP